ncbi:MAG: acyltransferase [Cyanobacteriota bacterium]|nr:acyltransferase [Cyanobacteriota bacterium]
MDDKIQNSRLLSLTNFCKGIAILWIVLVHFKGGWFGWQGVHIFLILSGFGLAYSCLKSGREDRWNHWFYKRFKRILPAYWVAVLASAPFLIFLDLGPKPGASAGVFKTILDFFLLNNVFEQFRGGGTGAFWYVPFIVGAYLLFPWMYKALRKCSKPHHYLIFFLAIAAIEFSYRAIAIYTLDGQPIGYSEKFFTLIPNSVEALKERPDWLFGFFQRRAPFGFIPSRLSEFALGMMAGFAVFYKPRQFDRILFSPYAGYLGFAIWLGSQGLMYAGLWGWIFADFAMSLGLIVWLLNVAHFWQKKSNFVFSSVTTLGIWSYYIYLTHHPFARLFPQVRDLLTPAESSTPVRLAIFGAVFGVTLACIAAMSWLLAQFDRSNLPETMMNVVVAGLSPVGGVLARVAAPFEPMGQLAKLYGMWWILMSLLVLCSLGGVLKVASTQSDMAPKIERLKKQQHQIATKIDRILSVQ